MPMQHEVRVRVELCVAVCCACAARARVCSHARTSPVSCLHAALCNMVWMLGPRVHFVPVCQIMAQSWKCAHTCTRKFLGVSLAILAQGHSSNAFIHPTINILPIALQERHGG